MFPLGDLFDLQASAFGEALFQFGQGQTQDTVHILSLDLVGIHAGDVKASLVGAVGALHADHFVLLVLFLDLGFALSPDDQRVILNVQRKLWFLSARIFVDTWCQKPYHDSRSHNNIL